MTHEPIDGRLVCGVKADKHRWLIQCLHNRDPDFHAHQCCLHAGVPGAEEPLPERRRVA